LITDASEEEKENDVDDAINVNASDNNGENFIYGCR
jgi:hypothetical protein